MWIGSESSCMRSRMPGSPCSGIAADEPCSRRPVHSSPLRIPVPSAPPDATMNLSPLAHVREAAADFFIQEYKA